MTVYRAYFSLKRSHSISTVFLKPLIYDYFLDLINLKMYFATYRQLSKPYIEDNTAQ